ncbi:unnamed protein product [Cunninghamella blakesleeana]
MEIIERKGIQVNQKVLRHCIYIINILLSYEESSPFTTPVPPDAYIYYACIKHPMDFATLEKNVYENKYPSYIEFEEDLSLIWKNATEFHLTIDAIYKQALAIKKYYEESVANILSMKPTEKLLLLQKTIPEEYIPLITNDLPEFSTDRDIYMVQVVLPMEKSKAMRGYGKKLRKIYDDLNKNLYDCIQDNNFSNKYKETMIPLPRLYISKNRSLLIEACKTKSYIAILSNVKSTIPIHKDDQRKDLLVITFDVTIAIPMSDDIHRFEPFAVDTDTTTHVNYCPKSFIKVLPVKTYRNVSTMVSNEMEKQYFKHAFANHKLQYNPTPLNNSGNPPKSYKKKGMKYIKEYIPQSEDFPLIQQLMRSLWEGDYKNATLTDDDNQISSSSSISNSLPNKLVSSSINENSLAYETTNISTSTSTVHIVKNEEQASNIKSLSSPLLSLQPPPPVSSESLPLSTKFTLTPPSSQIENVQCNKNDTNTPIINLLSTIMKDDELMNSTNKYYQDSKKIYSELKQYAALKNVPIEKASKYSRVTSTYANAEGYFKQVRYVDNDKSIVVQTFRRTTTTQRVTEIVCLLKLKSLPHMANIREILEDDEGNIVGLTMERYEYTLKQYTHEHSHHSLTAPQKWDIIQQILKCLQVIHENGISHRDLSEVNFMVNKNTNSLLEDGNPSAQVHLIDFGKAIFTQKEDAYRWWIKPIPQFIKEKKGRILGSSSISSTASASSTWLDQLVTLPSPSTTLLPLTSSIPTTSITFWTSLFEYEGEVIPETEEKLQDWCGKLPWIKIKPDHGYRHYRSIQTLPRNRTDYDILPWFVDPIAEDIYSIGTIMWKIFSGTEPWHGILDNDLRGLREIVETDRRLYLRLKREVNGDLSKELLLLCLKTQPEDRKSAQYVLDWMGQPNIKENLIKEWDQYAPTERKRRRAKAAHQFEEEQAKQFQNTSYFPNSIINKDKIKKKEKLLLSQRHQLHQLVEEKKENQ